MTAHKIHSCSETTTVEVLGCFEVHDEMIDSLCTVKHSNYTPDEEAAFKMLKSNRESRSESSILAYRKEKVLSYKEIKLIKVKLGHQDNRNSHIAPATKNLSRKTKN